MQPLAILLLTSIERAQWEEQALLRCEDRVCSSRMITFGSGSLSSPDSHSKFGLVSNSVEVVPGYYTQGLIGQTSGQETIKNKQEER